MHKGPRSAATCGVEPMICICALAEDAADKIELLRKEVDRLKRVLTKMDEYEIRRLGDFERDQQNAE